MPSLRYILSRKAARLAGVTIIVLGIFSGCHKVKDYPPGPYLVPHGLLFRIERTGIQLPDSVLRYLKLTYNYKGEKYDVEDFLPAIEPLDSLGIMTTRSIGILSSAGKKVKTYYLEYPGGDVDTVYVDYDYIPRAHADTTACYCLYPLREVRFNGREAYPDSTIKVQQVFLFKK